MHSAFIANTVSVEDASVFSSQTFRFLCIFTYSLVGVFGKGQKIRGSKELLPPQDLGTGRGRTRTRMEIQAQWRTGFRGPWEDHREHSGPIA